MNLDTRIDVTYSPDDGGWYAEVYDHNGRTIHETKVFATRAEAVIAARDWN